ncbi:MAG: flippase-like domain-containing protein [Gammaproteobacteria bacterium]|nr:flippase-like domain-containing protein [Gammaproteobacteria bacterium]
MAKFARLIVRWFVPLIGGGLALAAMFFLYRSLNFNLFLDELKAARFWWIVVLAATILLEQLIQGWKWRQLLYDLKPISSARLTGAFLAGYGANILVPLGISPLVRSWLIARLEELRMATVLVTTAISRFIDGIVFAIVAGVVALTGQIPNIEGDLRTGVAVAGALNLILFSGALWLLFRSRAQFALDNSWISRVVDWLAAKGRGTLNDLRGALAKGIVWPQQRARQTAIIAASFAMKAVATTHFVWAGLAVGVTLEFFDYLFLMVFAGFALVLARFIRVPGGFVIGSGFALKLLGVPDEQALAMILLNHMISIILVVGIGLVVLWQSGIDIRAMAQNIEKPDASP